MSLASRLYNGQTTYDIVGTKKIWYVVATAITLICLGSILFRGFNLGIEFEGGASFQFEAPRATVEDAREVVEDAGVPEPIVQTIGDGIRIQTEPLTDAERGELVQSLSQRFDVEPEAINDSTVGPAWGDQITGKAIRGLVLFLIAVVIYLSVRFEPKMAAAAIVALIHDLIITAGVYSLVGFVVTPATVIGLLTILGYSLYDTVVIFDKVLENTRGLTGNAKQTYTEAANLALNQTLIRSINTSLIALLPVAALLFVGGYVLGAGTLPELALALFIGILAGTYSSIFLATPVLADLKEREPQFKALAGRVAARRAGGSATTPQSRAAARRAGSADAGASTATAVLDRPEDGDAATTPAPVAAKPSGGKRQPQRPQQKRKGGRPNRPSGKRKR